MTPVTIIDCTLRDGGYYNNWDFSTSLINEYLLAMSGAGVDIVELGFRSLKNDSFKGACAYTTDEFLTCLSIPQTLSVGVMINAAELIVNNTLDETRLVKLFPNSANLSKVKLVRVACHVHEFGLVLPVCSWLKKQGFRVGFNLMQVSDRTDAEITALAKEAAKWPIDALYFADSMGSMAPAQTRQIISSLRQYWQGALGVHAHDNMGLALQNTLAALDAGATWLDATVTGMGRGPGNAKTEQLVLEVADRRGTNLNLIPLMSIIRTFFQPLQQHSGWGTNTYYYLAGKYGIHPSYVQQMLGDARYNEEDILAVIEYLRVEGGKSFSLNTLDVAKYFYQGKPRGKWNPALLFEGREVLVLGSGPGISAHKFAIENYIRRENPIVIALNTQSHIAAELISVRIACHPVRLLADCESHAKLPQPLITPVSMLPANVLLALQGKELLDYGLGLQEDNFEFADTHCILPNSLVISYALAVINSGKSTKILLAGFDGFSADDPRAAEMDKLISIYNSTLGAVPVISVTPTRYALHCKSIYAI